MDVLGKIDTSFTSDKALLEEVKNALHIKDTTVSIPEKKDLDQLTDYLERMDVLTNVSYKREEKKYIFTQPGLRYAQVEAIVDVLKYSDALQDKPRQERNFILSEVHNCLEGKMLEDMIFIDLFREKEVYEKYRVGQYRNNVSGKEFDLCLIDEKENESVIFEVKHSKIPVKEQTKHLANEDFCQEFEERTNTKIREKAVIYQGKTGSFFGMKYLNAEEFLLHGDLFKDLLFPGKGLGMDSDAHKVKNEVDKEVGFAPSSEVGFAPSFDPSVDGGLNLFVEDPEQ
jgi:hypothetical protein